MVAPIFLLSKGCGHLCAAPRIAHDQANRSAKMLAASVFFDVAAFLTPLVLGILGATSVIHLSSCVSYSLMGISGLCVLPYAIMLVKGFLIARAGKEENEDGSFRLISRDITGYFRLIPQVLKAAFVRADTQ